MTQRDRFQQTVKAQLLEGEEFIAGAVVRAGAAAPQGARTRWIGYLGLTSYRLFVIQGGRVEALPLRSIDPRSSLSAGRDRLLRPTVVVAGERFTFDRRNARLAHQIARALASQRLT